MIGPRRNRAWWEGEVSVVPALVALALMASALVGCVWMGVRLWN